MVTRNYKGVELLGGAPDGVYVSQPTGLYTFVKVNGSVRWLASRLQLETRKYAFMQPVSDSLVETMFYRYVEAPSHDGDQKE
jgi:hypothetical protein